MRYIFGYLSPPRVYASVLYEIFKKRVGFFYYQGALYWNAVKFHKQKTKRNKFIFKRCAVFVRATLPI